MAMCCQQITLFFLQDTHKIFQLSGDNVFMSPCQGKPGQEAVRFQGVCPSILMCMSFHVGYKCPLELISRKSITPHTNHYTIMMFYIQMVNSQLHWESAIIQHPLAVIQCCNSGGGDCGIVTQLVGKGKPQGSYSNSVFFVTYCSVPDLCNSTIQ